jgi:hypothetical protein
MDDLLGFKVVIPVLLSTSVAGAGFLKYESMV